MNDHKSLLSLLLFSMFYLPSSVCVLFFLSIIDCYCIHIYVVVIDVRAEAAAMCS